MGLIEYLRYAYSLLEDYTAYYTAHFTDRKQDLRSAQNTV
jgi:hypothetical protein